MTNKPILSVERELLERLTENWNGTDACIELRALLDKPNSWPCWSCKQPVSMRERADADGECPHCAAELDIEDWPFPSKPAAQHQGDPVACVIAFREGVKEPELLSWKQMPVGEHRLYAEQPAPVAVFNPERALLERWAGLRGEISLDQVYQEARSLLEKPAPTAYTMRSVMEITQEASKYYVVGTSNWCAHIATRLNGVKPVVIQPHIK